MLFRSPNSVAETALALYYIVKGGGFTTGGINFDAKVRRQSIDPQDMFHGHVGAMDVTARALLVAEKMITDGRLEAFVAARYAGWRTPFGADVLAGKHGLDDLAARVLAANTDPLPVSGRQEHLENLANQFL